MASFKDKKGNDWGIELNIGVCRRIKTISGLDFANAHDGKAVSEIQSNDEKMVQVLWLLCGGQAKDRSLSEDDFVFLLDGNVLQEAQGAIEEALLGFTRPERRAALEALLNKKKEAMSKAVSQAVAEVNAIDLDKELEKRKALSTAGS